MKKILLITTILLMCLSGCQKQETKEDTAPTPAVEKEEVKPATVEVITPEPEETSETEDDPRQETEDSPQGMTVDEDASYEVEPDSDYIIN